MRAVLLVVALVAPTARALKQHHITFNQTLVPIPQVVSRGGSLHHTLKVEGLHVTVDAHYTDMNGALHVDTFDFLTRSYNGELPGKTIVVRPGDTLEITVENNLGRQDELGAVNTLHHLNTTNLHTHGLHVSPEEPADFILAEIHPGEERTYVYPIQDDHMPGIHWYHPHKHGSTAVQTAGGMEGILLVAEKEGDVPKKIGTFPEVLLNILAMPFDGVLQVPMWRGDDDVDIAGYELRARGPPVSRNFALAALNRFDLAPFAGSTNGMYGNTHFDSNLRGTGAQFVVDTPDAAVEEAKKKKKTIGTVFPFRTLALVNGHRMPRLELIVNKWTRIRALYASTFFYMNLKVDDVCETRLIAKDGVYLPENLPRRYDTTVLFPGGRTDFLIMCAETGSYGWVPTDETAESQGTYSERHETNFEEVSYTEKIQPFKQDSGILYFDVVAHPRRKKPQKRVDSVPVWTPAVPCYLQDLRGIPEGDVITFPLNYSVPALRNTQVGTVEDENALTINERVFPLDEADVLTKPLNDDTPLSLGDVVEFHTQGLEEHPSHLHVNPMQIYEVPANDPIGTADEGYFAVGDWHDTIMLNLKYAKLRMFLADYAGKLAVHCHILFHEDIGMIGLLQIDGDDSKEDSYAKIEQMQQQNCYNGARKKPKKAYKITGWLYKHNKKPKKQKKGHHRNMMTFAFRAVARSYRSLGVLSQALLDACVVGLVVGLIAIRYKKKANPRRTYTLIK